MHLIAKPGIGTSSMAEKENTVDTIVLTACTSSVCGSQVFYTSASDYVHSTGTVHLEQQMPNQKKKNIPAHVL